MLIRLDKSKLFTIDPAIRFSGQYDVPKELWTEMWRKYKLLDFTNRELREYFQMKVGRRTNSKTISLWIFRSEIYSMVKPIMSKGVTTVDSKFFKQHEQRVINEIVKHLKSGVTSDSRIMA